MHEYGENIKRIRKQRNITQGELADMVNVKRETMSRIERGTRYPSLQLLERIAKALGTTVPELLKNETKVS